MRHRMRGRKLGRNASHRKAMFRNMATSLIRSVRVDEDARNKPKVPGRIITTVAKAKELRPYVEKLITMARKAIVHEERALEFGTSAERNTSQWKAWRESDEWNQWNQAIAPALTLRRRAFSVLRDNQAVEILFDELASRFEDRPGGYTRVVRIAGYRLGDAGKQALIEFVGEGDRDRVKRKRQAPTVADDADELPGDLNESAEDESDQDESAQSDDANNTGDLAEETSEAESTGEAADEDGSQTEDESKE